MFWELATHWAMTVLTLWAVMSALLVGVGPFVAVVLLFMGWRERRKNPQDPWYGPGPYDPRR